MRLNTLLFSGNRKIRALRHSLYISVLGIAFFLQSIVPGTHIYHTAACSLLCFFPACILSVYCCLYILSPILAKQRYVKFGLGFLVMALLLLMLNCFAAWIFCQVAHYFFKAGRFVFNLAFINTAHALIIGGVTMGIQFSRNWYLRQKENTMLARQKVVTELQLEKARLYPRFLHQSLDNLRKDISKGSPTASTLLLKISDLLSYILYDNNEKWVPLEKELVMMQHLIDIEQSGRVKHLDIRVIISGVATGKYIVPMTLFQLLEHVFNAFDEHRHACPFIDLDIKINIDDMNVHLAIISHPDESEGPDWNKVFYRTGQRLDAIYPGGCQLKLKKERSISTLLLQVTLQHDISFSSSILSTEDSTLQYATP